MKICNETKFISIVAIMFLIPFITINLQFKKSNSQLQKVYALSYLEMRTQSASSIIADMLNENYNLSKITQSNAFLSDKKGQIVKLSKSVGAAYYDISLLDKNGKEVYRYTAAKNQQYDYEKSDVLKNAMQTKRSSGAVEYHRYMPPVLVVAEPILNKNKVNEGYLAARMSLAYIMETVRRMGSNSYGNMGLIDAGGQIIADSLSVSTVRPGVLSPEEILIAAEKARDDEILSSVQEVRGKKGTYLVSVSNVQGSDWWLYEVVDTRFISMYKPHIPVKYNTVYGIFMIIVLSFATCILAKRILLQK